MSKRRAKAVFRMGFVQKLGEIHFRKHKLAKMSRLSCFPEVVQKTVAVF
jgi:hypothetical protein